MIKVAVAFVCRVLVELGLVFFLFAGIACVIAFRFARRFCTPAPDKLDRISAELARMLSIGLVASRAAARKGDGEPELVFEFDELDGISEEEREQSVDFWRSVTV